MFLLHSIQRERREKQGGGVSCQRCQGRLGVGTSILFIGEKRVHLRGDDDL